MRNTLRTEARISCWLLPQRWIDVPNRMSRHVADTLKVQAVVNYVDVCGEADKFGRIFHRARSISSGPHAAT
jgi:hypothetical protein